MSRGRGQSRIHPRLMAFIISSPNKYFESLDINKFITKPKK